MFGVVPMAAVAAAAAAAAIAVAVRMGSTIAASFALALLLLARLWRPPPPQDASGKDLPGPGMEIPFIGATLVLLREFDRILDFLVEYQQAVGWGRTWGITTLRIGGFSEGCVVLATPAAVQH
eukprot:SAG11_NODE_14959_length_593_cov_1.273279_1_plen_122_part_10